MRSTLTLRNCLLGERIAKDELDGTEKAGYGKRQWGQGKHQDGAAKK